jgi:hypothetical protein
MSRRDWAVSGLDEAWVAVDLHQWPLDRWASASMSMSDRFGRARVRGAVGVG